MLRMSAAVVGMGTGAALVALLAFGSLTLVISLPALLGTVLILLAVHLSEPARRTLREHRAARYQSVAPMPGGLMSGFFEIPDRAGPVQRSEPSRSGITR